MVNVARTLVLPVAIFAPTMKDARTPFERGISVVAVAGEQRQVQDCFFAIGHRSRQTVCRPGMIKVLALDPMHPAGLALLDARQDIKRIHLTEPTDDTIAERLRDAEILLLRGRRLVPKQFDTVKSIRLVTRGGVGNDNIDCAQMGRNGLTVSVSADANYVSIADRAVSGGERNRRDSLGACDVRDNDVPVVGFGPIGQEFAQCALAFGAHLSFYGPFLPKGTDVPRPVRRKDDLAQAVSDADIASLHRPRTTQTTNLIDAGLLARFWLGSVLINTGRGGVVDEPALAKALDTGRPAIYATGALAFEPAGANDLPSQRADANFATQSAATTLQRAIRGAVGAARNALDFVDGNRPNE